MKRILAVAVAAVVLAGCEKPQEQKPPARMAAEQAVESLSSAQNSPDITVKSWWSAKDAWVKVAMAQCESSGDLMKKIQNNMETLAGPEIKTSIDCNSVEKYDRKIEDVQVQSDTRAVVQARVRNVTPPDPGADTDSEHQRIKDLGDQIRYVLERKDANDGWKIVGATSKPGWSSKWDDILKKPEPYNHRYVSDGLQ
jgi:hypothetical protein